MDIRPATPKDSDSWLTMRLGLWPEGSAADHRRDIDRYFSGRSHEPREVLLAVERGQALGFVELSIRNIVDGCDTDHVGYLEGWFVAPEARRRGVGGALVRAAEAWAVSQGCSEFGSDALIDNTVSLAAHKALGFEETSRVCTFRKDLKQRADDP
ncbi:MAG TPA: aminoglycoside 6'-N-acetyltransferase [Gemmatimonadales bacterium]|jgi:aminoglycoside 6'-N-acetyltransferase I